MPQGPFNTLIAKIMQQTGALSAAFAAIATDKQSGLLVSGLHGRKYQQAYQGNLFFGANQSGATLSNGLATTYTGLCVSNPAGSGKNLVLRRASGIIVVAPAAMQPLSLITGFAAGGITVHTTPLTVQAATVGGSVTGSVAKIDAACTLVGTPVLSKHLATNNATTNNAAFDIDLEGELIVPPGGYCAVGSPLAAGPTSGFLGSFEWEEVNP